MTFQGYTPQALHLLAEIPTFTKAEFAERKSDWTNLLLTPTKHLVQDLAPLLQTHISSSIQALPKTNGSISPIHHDTRFKKEKFPLYKEYIMLTFWDGPTKQTAPALRMRFSPHDHGFAAGIALTKTGLPQWRQKIDDPKTGQQLQTILQNLKTTIPHLEFAPPDLKRVPAPYPSDHTRGHLLRHKFFQARFGAAIPPSIHTAEFTTHIIDQFKNLLPLHEWLKENIYDN